MQFTLLYITFVELRNLGTVLALRCGLGISTSSMTALAFDKLRDRKGSHYQQDMDFTLKIYRKLLETLQAQGYQFLTFEQYCMLGLHPQDEALNRVTAESPSNNASPSIRALRHAQGPNEIASPTKYIILRHDVDLKAENSVETAKIEHSLGIKASYYFRVVPDSDKPDCIKAIADMGHEIGYHYEDMSLCGGNPEKAVAHFAEKLAYFRTYYPVKTICMHGAPTSQYDSKDIWQFASYKNDFDLIGEPYFDVDFSDLFYLTDTGRRWDGYKVSVRDKIPTYQDVWTANGWVYKRTDDIIRACNNGTLPNRIMITTHPQRWTDSKVKGMQEAIVQNLKNTVKYLLIKWRSK